MMIYGHVSAPKDQATSLYRQHFSKSNDQTQMIPNLNCGTNNNSTVIKNGINWDVSTPFIFTFHIFHPFLVIPQGV